MSLALSLPMLTAEMLAKKASDPSPRIFRCRFVITNVNDTQRFEPPCAGIVKEGVASFRILFHIVRNFHRSERLLQFLRHTPVPRVLRTVASHNRTGPRQKGFRILRQGSTVIHTRCSEPTPGRE